MPENIIRIKDLTKRFGKKRAVDHLSLDINEGEILGLVGVNGSGKTTLLRVLVGYYQPDGGEIFFRNMPFSRVHNIRRKIGISTQDGCFYPKLTVRENVEYFGRLYGMTPAEIEASLDSTLRLVNLHNMGDVLAKNLSGGMQKRIGIACAIIHSPQVIILDEPTSDLDVFLRKEMIELIRLINDTGITVIIASHHLQELEGLCHRVGIMDDGKVLNIGTPEELKSLYPRRDISLEDIFERVVRGAQDARRS